MNGAALSAGPWLVLGAVLGLLLALAVALTVAATRRRRPPPPAAAESASAEGWAVDDLPGFLDDPAGAPDTGTAVPAPLFAGPPAPGPTAPAPDGAGGRTLPAMALAALLLVGAAAVVAVLGSGDRARSPVAGGTPGGTATPTTAAERPAPVPDLPAVPESPAPGDAGAGRLAERSVPVGADGVVAELAFDGIVLERRAVGVTAAYPTLRLTAAEVPDGPAVAHVELPTFNCLTDRPPADPVAAGCLRTPVEHADLPTPALAVTREGDGLRITGRFPTYLRPNGSAPEWTGRVYPLTVTVTPGRTDGGADGLLEIGAEDAGLRDEPGLTVLRVPR